MQRPTIPPGDPWTWSAVDTATAVGTGLVSALEVTRSHLERLDAVRPLNAVTRRDDTAALARAARLDADRDEGRPLGPLAGVAVTIKDSVDVAGQSSPNGVAALDERVAERDAPLVEHLQRAGAIVIGRTNAPEFSWRWHTDNPLFGPTANPWSAAHTPGGSSGGGAAAVAAGAGNLAQGSDAGGSLRWPASCCGVSTIRPTQHRVPMHNSTSDAERSPAIDLMAVAGPIGRRVADVALMLEVMAQPSWRDPAHVPAAAPAAPPPGARRLGIPRGPLEVTGPVGEALDVAARRLTAAGWVLVEVDLPPVEEAAQLWAVLLNTDFHHTVRARFWELGSPALRAMLTVLDAVGPATDLDGYLRLLARRATLVRRWQQVLHETVDVVLLPVCREPTWPAGDDATSAQRLSELYRANDPLVAINFLGLPSAAQPVGLFDGMPIGVQLVAARFAEATALAAAADLEAAGPIDHAALWSTPWW
ncbi:MAG: amidase [Acidimicrobiales bacterium]|nr:amidase [Acidimicrobiales bacterium]